MGSWSGFSLLPIRCYFYCRDEVYPKAWVRADGELCSPPGEAAWSLCCISIVPAVRVMAYLGFCCPICDPALVWLGLDEEYGDGREQCAQTQG